MTTAATCAKAGTKTERCACGATRTVTIPATGNHSYTSKVTKAATCTATGTKTYTCSCGKSYTESIAATGHNWGAWKTTKAATVLAKGTSQRKCSSCSEIQSKDIAQLDNNYSNTEILSRLEANKINILPVDVYFNADGSLTVKACIYNNTSIAQAGISVTRMAVYDRNNNLIAEATFNTQNLLLGVGRSCYYDYIFPANSIRTYTPDMSHVYTNSLYKTI